MPPVGGVVGERLWKRVHAPLHSRASTRAAHDEKLNRMVEELWKIVNTIADAGFTDGWCGTLEVVRTYDPLKLFNVELNGNHVTCYVQSKDDAMAAVDTLLALGVTMSFETSTAYILKGWSAKLSLV